MPVKFVVCSNQIAWEIDLYDDFVRARFCVWHMVAATAGYIAWPARRMDIGLQPACFCPDDTLSASLVEASWRVPVGCAAGFCMGGCTCQAAFG